MKHLHRHLALAIALVLGGISAGIAPDASAHGLRPSFKHHSFTLRHSFKHHSFKHHSFTPRHSFKHHSFKPKHFRFIESHPGFHSDHGIHGRKFLVVPKSFGHFDDLRGDHHFKRRIIVPDKFGHFDGSRAIIIVR